MAFGLQQFSDRSSLFAPKKRDSRQTSEIQRREGVNNLTAFQGNIAALQLHPSLRQALGEHLLSSYPHEACGLLLGAAAAGGMRINGYTPMRNVAPDPLHTFVPHPEDWVQAAFSDPAPVGFFHTHPNSPPVPSLRDLDGLSSLGPNYRVYLIGAPDPECGIRLQAYEIHRSAGPQGIADGLIPIPHQFLLK